jgi:TPR repeat protein
MEASRWYQRAAAQGEADAQYNLATYHYEGIGFAQDTAEAVRLFRLSADQGNKGALDALGQLGLRP